MQRKLNFDWGLRTSQHHHSSADSWMAKDGKRLDNIMYHVLQKITNEGGEKN
jgi:hypothetical protein